MTGGRKRQEVQLKGWEKIRALAEMVLRSGGVVVLQVHPDANVWSCQNLGQWCQKWGMCKVTTWASRWGATKEEQCWKFMTSDQHLAQIMAGPAETLSMPTRAQRGDRKLKSVYSLSFAAEVHRTFRAMALRHISAISSTEQYLKQNQSQRAMQREAIPAQTAIEATASPISESKSVDEGWVMAALYSSASDDEDPIETESVEKQHSEEEVHVPGAVARPVGKGEIARSPEAQEALKKEWTRLEKLGTWDTHKVKEWRDVANIAKRQGVTVHVGKIFDICVEKGSELPIGDPARKFKGRAVFQGNNVVDQNHDVAMFNQLSSSPATMEAAKFADFYGMIDGHVSMIADGRQAYTQSRLGGTPNVGANSSRTVAAAVALHDRPRLPTCSRAIWAP